MAKKTLLEVTQSVLSSMNSDSVNSIGDMEESLQVAEKAKEVYEDLMALEEWKHLRCLVQLESLADSEKPNFLRIPTNVSEILDIRYDKREKTSDGAKFNKVHYKEPDDFITLLVSHNETDDNVDLVTLPVSGIQVHIKNNLNPSWWTSFDDQFIVFDAYNKEVDSTLQQSKNLTRCVKEPEFRLEDNFIPDMPSKMFPAYLQEVTRVCSLYFKEQPSPNDERRAFRSLATMKNKSGKVQNRKIRYGRR